MASQFQPFYINIYGGSANILKFEDIQKDVSKYQRYDYVCKSEYFIKLIDRVVWQIKINLIIEKQNFFEENYTQLYQLVDDFFEHLGTKKTHTKSVINYYNKVLSSTKQPIKNCDEMYESLRSAIASIKLYNRNEINSN